MAQKSFSTGKIGARVSLDGPTTAVDPLWCALCEPRWAEEGSSDARSPRRSWFACHCLLQRVDIDRIQIFI